MSSVLPPIPAPTVPVTGSASGNVFPVHRIYCVGRNYVDHAIEMGGTGREEPFFFMKPADAVLPVPEGVTGGMAHPPMSSDLHHEVELVVAIGRGGRNIPPEQALEHVWGYAVGLDMTRRDLQAEAKKLGRPWCAAKGFDASAPISPIRPASECYLTAATAIALEVNGAKRQYSVLGKMIWSVPEIVAKLSQLWRLEAGDLIFTGTPEGVARVNTGDVLGARIDGVGGLKIQVTEPSPDR